MRSAERAQPHQLTADLPDFAGVPEPAAPVRVLLLNHQRDPFRELVTALRRAGYEAAESRSLAESHRSLEGTAPDVVILNPLVLKAGGVELAIAESLQAEDRPVPVILCIESLQDLEQARQLKAPVRDFVVRPVVVDEVLHRIALALRHRDELLRLQSRARELEGQVSVDHKTGLLSDRYFRQVFQIEFKRAQRHQTPLSLLLVDVDDFKRINDSTEYSFGDLVLRHVAQTLRHDIRETDFAARMGGDEFVLLLPQTTPAEAVQTAMRIRKKIAQQVVQSRGYTRSVTLSIGIDTFDGRSESSPLELRARANKALHEAKRRGKNQVWLYSADESSPPAAATGGDG